MLARIPLVDLKAQYRSIKAEIDAAIQRVVDRTEFILGGEVGTFERNFAAYLGAHEVVGIASGSAALQLALLACGIRHGDEVITPSFTFVATAEAIIHAGARPVFVDIDPATYNLDPNQVEAAITPRTRAILPVHLYGQSAEMAALSDMAERRELWLIEDAAQAHGAEYCGKRCGTLGHLACFSFYPGKNLGAYGDAGAVTGNDPTLMARVRKLRDHGRSGKYVHDDLGFGERLDALQAAVLDVKLRYLESWVERRRAHARMYNAMLADCEVNTPPEADGVRHAYCLYVIRTADRDYVMATLRERGVGASIHYPVPVHQQPVMRKLGYDGARLPVTERVCQEVLSLPLYPELEQSQIEYIVGVIRECVQ